MVLCPPRIGMAGRKIFVGSLPQDVSAELLRLEFSKFGEVEDVYVKVGCEPGRQWAFITFLQAEQAQRAKDMCDRQLVIPGADRPCDVMLAKHQGLFGTDPLGAVPSAAGSAPRKIFVGSLPDGVQDLAIRAEFSKYGIIEDVLIKPDCPQGRQWAFVTYTTSEEADYAQRSTNNILIFPGGSKTCEVTLARNQGMFGQNPVAAPAPHYVPPVYGVAAPPPAVGWGTLAAAPVAPKKIFVGSLPEYVSDDLLRAEFGAFGTITDVYVKTGCENGRNWAFVTFTSPEEAQRAKDACDRNLTFPGCDKPIEVTLARHQGKFGQDAMNGAAPHGAAPALDGGPRKIFVGSLPDGVDDWALRQAYAKYGQVTEVFIKMGEQSGRHWAFVTFASAEQASAAKVGTDRILTFPGSQQPCEVKLAKNQGLFGTCPTGGVQQPPAAARGYTPPAYNPQAVQAQAQAHGVVPPPPASNPPAHLTPWRMYKTVSGIPYYHNSKTGQTVWECPPDLQAQPVKPRYAPY